MLRCPILSCDYKSNEIDWKVNVTCVKTMNILIVNQSIVDMGASFFTLLTTVVEVDGTRMSRDSTLAGTRHVTGLVCHVISPTTCSFVTSG